MKYAVKSNKFKDLNMSLNSHLSTKNLLDGLVNMAPDLLHEKISSTVFGVLVEKDYQREETHTEKSTP